jgi:hypothetical protein
MSIDGEVLQIGAGTVHAGEGVLFTVTATLAVALPQAGPPVTVYM